MDRQTLIRKRASIKAMLTVQETFFLNFTVDSIEEHELLMARLDHINGILSRFDEIQSEIESLDEQIETEERQLFEDRFFKLVARCRALVRESPFNPDLQTVQVIEPPPSPPQTNNIVSDYIKLPDIKLPVFDGNITQWCHFRDLIAELIINNPSIKDSAKFFHLNNALAPNLQQAIANIPQSASNFSVAWKFLTSRYDNPRLQVIAHVDQIFNPPKYTPDSAASLRSLVDHVKANLSSLKTLALSVSLEDLFIQKIILDRLDLETLKIWEQHSSVDSVPTLDDLLGFIERRARVLDVAPPNQLSVKQDSSVASATNSKLPTNKDYHILSKCIFCSQNHRNYACPRFLNWSVQERRNKVSHFNLCRNCIAKWLPGHKCSPIKCRKCGKPHHTLLHFEPAHSERSSLVSYRTASENSGSQSNVSSRPSTSHSRNRGDHTSQESTPSQSSARVASATTLFSDTSTYCLLATATVLVLNGDNTPVKCRALLDGGSDCNLMTYHCKDELCLPTSTTSVNVSGLCLSSHNVSKAVNISLASINSDFKTDVKCLLVPQITSNLPPVNIDISSWYLPTELAYADPDFHLSRPIDILLGANLFFSLLLPGKLSPGRDLPYLQNTLLGWVLAGSTPSNLSSTADFQTTKRVHCMTSASVSNEQLNDQLKRFWEVEDVSHASPLSHHNPVEQHFAENTVRDDSGRYVVTLPKKPNHTFLGSSKSLALKRFFSLEKRLSKNPQLKQEYVQFMTDYELLGHMRVAESTALPIVYHIPHHPVFKLSSTSTKLRVVFDASAPSTSGFSLNDTLEVGPTVQPDLLSTVLRFRTRDIALVADIVKMYRQVRVSEEDLDLQRIFWRPSPDLPLKEYQLTTVTYGTAPAAFLATRSLNQLIADEGEQYPLAASIVNRDFYVDDFISCCDNPSQAISVYHQLTEMLAAGGFELRKWATNSLQVLDQIPVEHRAVSNIKSFDNTSDASVQTLGLLWHVDQDHFKIQYRPSEKATNKPFTKRLILSIIASIFDPLGLIAPIVISCKAFMQSLWLSKLNWDEPVTDELLQLWFPIWSKLPEIVDITIPRLLKPLGFPVLVHLHVFADASTAAYGAAAYLVVFTESKVSSHLVFAKSRVAPLKPMTIPRLELSAALLAANLCHKIHSTLDLTINQSWLWSDSTIVLSWIRKPPRDFKSFVSSRLADVNELTHQHQWLHVPSRENPADCITRGLTPKELNDHLLWWHGPEWLIQPQISWPAQPKLTCCDVSEVKHSHVTLVHNNLNNNVLTKYGSYLKTIAVMSYVLRFIHNVTHPNHLARLSGPLSVTELEGAFHKSVKIIQSIAYPSEIAKLTEGKPVSAKSTILSLRPFLDNSGLIRVGGRLEHSLLTFSAKHQILLPRNHHLVKIYVRYVHIRLSHASAQMVLAEVRQRLWIPSLKNTIKQVLRACVVCFKHKVVTAQQIMGQLPNYRVQPSPVFSNVGIDYAGPITIKYGGPRSKNTTKCYLAVFVCMATTAVHVEPVTSLSTKSFLDAFSRFTSRRGFPSQVFSDNATNFRGAHRELSEFCQFLESQEFQDEVQTSTSRFNINWKFSPPRSPHFGGLWETIIKNLKTHLYKIMGNTTYTFEELLTVVTFIESVLNSRPLCKMSEDIDDFHYLSPAHFLIGRPLTTLPLPDLQHIPIGRLDRYQRLQHSCSQLWQHWSRDYLMSLQRLSKWKTPFPNLKIHQPVLVIEDSLLTNAWTLGVIVELHPGADKLVRVVTVRTRGGLFKRAIAKIAPLPIID